MNLPEETVPGYTIDWDRLADHLEAFLGQWEQDGYGPPLADFLPEQPAVLRRQVLIELIKVDLEYRYSSGGPILKLEDYLAEHPELGQPDGMPIELIEEEFQVRRRQQDETVEAQDYVARFPDKASQIQQRLVSDGAEDEAPTGTDLSHTFQPGEHLGDFYLMSPLGAGAFGSVYLARQESMQRLVALKVSSDRGTEAQTLAQLDHPNIVRVFDQVQLPEQKLRLLYMQFVAGGTLQAVVRAAAGSANKCGQLVARCIADAVGKTGVASTQHVSLKDGLADKPWAEVTCQLGMELAQALHYAHGQGILHRDVKPANVLLEADGSARLADFNISFSASVNADAEASFGGSLGYMSPEQLEACDSTKPTRPIDLDARSDIYSLGILLWELMYGTRPFADQPVEGQWAETLDGMVRLRRQGVGDPPQAPGSPGEHLLLNILRRCLAPVPADRYQNAADLARDLNLCVQPRVARLIERSRSGWRSVALAWPVLAFLIAAVAPHGVAAVFNYLYNETKIVQTLLPDQRHLFLMLVPIINGTAFSVAIGWCIVRCLPVARAIRGGPDTDREQRSTARIRSLGLSRFVTLLGITEWGIAGLAYPIALYAIVGRLNTVVPIYFFGSLLLCGLLAAAYPFFLTATLTVQAFVPALLTRNQLTSVDADRLKALSAQSAWSLYLAGGVPAVGMMILLATDEAADSLGNVTLKAFSLLGAVGFAFVLHLSSHLQSDIDALLQTIRRSPVSDSPSGDVNPRR